jgi:hypothetical protein
MFQTMKVKPFGFKATGAGGNTPWVPELPLLKFWADAGVAAAPEHTNAMTASAYWIVFLMSTITVLLDSLSRLLQHQPACAGHRC